MTVAREWEDRTVNEGENIVNPGTDVREETQATEPAQATASPPLPIEERLNRAMRPAEDVTIDQFIQAILDVIDGESDEHSKVNALAYVLEEVDFAPLSGPRTPKSEYPTVTDETFEFPQWSKPVASLDALKVHLQGFMKHLQGFEDVHDRLGLVKARIRVDKPASAREQAFIIWTDLLSREMTPQSRRYALGHILRDAISGKLGQKVTPVAVTFDQQIPPEAYDGIIYSFREVIRKLRACLKADSYETNTGFAAAILECLKEIPGPQEQAAVLGFFLQESFVRKTSTSDGVIASVVSEAVERMFSTGMTVEVVGLGGNDPLADPEDKTNSKAGEDLGPEGEAGRKPYRPRLEGQG